MYIKVQYADKKTKIMKIALFTDSFLPGIGGTENVVYRYALELVNDNEVVVCAPKYRGNYDDSQFPFRVIRAKSIKLTSNDCWAMPKISKKFRSELLEFSPDIIHCHTMGMMTGFANWYSKKYNVPVMHTLHTNLRYCYLRALKLNFLVNIVLKRLAKRTNRADAVFAVSSAMKKEAISYGVNKEIAVIKNGGEILDKAIDKQVNNGIFRFLFVGLVSSIKNLRFTLDALKIVKDTRTDFIYTIIGRGPDINKLKKYAKKIGLEKHVIFTGPISDKSKLNDYYLQSDLFLFPSIIDSDGLVMLEAGNFSTPSLVIEGTGPAERIVDGENGFISGRMETDFASKILDLMKDRQTLLEVGKNSKSMFRPWSENKAEYLKVYKSLVESRRQ